MEKINKELAFFVHLARVSAVLSRRLDAGLNGIGFTEFVLMYHVSQAEGGRMRRVDLAEKLGLTASGVTRLLLPMEKIGLVRREADKSDARVSYVVLGAGGKQKLSEGIERAELYISDILPRGQQKKLIDFTNLLAGIS